MRNKKDMCELINLRQFCLNSLQAVQIEIVEHKAAVAELEKAASRLQKDLVDLEVELKQRKKGRP